MSVETNQSPALAVVDSLAVDVLTDNVSDTYVSKTTFLNYLNRLKAGGYGWPFLDAYTGHRHTHDEAPMSDGLGAWYQTGSTESENRYARDGLGTSAHPSQRLHFIDPIVGRVTAQYKIWLGPSPQLESYEAGDYH